jgi:hypothetical protein
MTGLTKGMLGALAAAALIAAPARSQTDSTLHMDQVMSPAEMQATGVSSLTPEQRAALDAWLVRYTNTLAIIARHGAEQAATSATGEVGEPLSVYDGHRIRDVAQDGGRITLQDGTVWDVYLPDRPSADTWKKGDFVLVSIRGAFIASQGQPYDHLIVNGRTHSTASARIEGREGDDGY